MIAIRGTLPISGKHFLYQVIFAGYAVARYCRNGQIKNVKNVKPTRSKPLNPSLGKIYTVAETESSPEAFRRV